MLISLNISAAKYEDVFAVTSLLLNPHILLTIAVNLECFKLFLNLHL